MSNFVSGPAGVELNRDYLTETELLDRYVGNRLWNQGDNYSGSLGDGTRTSRSSPVQTISKGVDWKQTHGVYGHRGAVKTDGTLWMWGLNSWYYNTNHPPGQLGIGNFIPRSSPVQTASGGTNWKQVACGGYHTVAVKTDGTLWVWGSNSMTDSGSPTTGQLGTNVSGHRSTPVQTVAAGTNWKECSAGWAHSAGIKTDGTLWLWGKNGYGELGDGTRTNRNSPVQTIAGGTTWKQVVTGGTTLAIKTDGTLWGWGHNTHGQLGDGTRSNRSSPVQTVSGGTNWKQVAGGEWQSGAIKTDGSLWMWGDNGAGDLGDGTRTHRSSPVQTIAGGYDWKEISCGDGSNGAVKTDGTLWFWGDNEYGQFGDGTTTHRSSPVQTLAGGSNWKSVSVGYSAAAISFKES